MTLEEAAEKLAKLRKGGDRKSIKRSVDLLITQEEAADKLETSENPPVDGF